MLIAINTITFAIAVYDPANYSGFRTKIKSNKYDRKSSKRLSKSNKESTK